MKKLFFLLIIGIISCNDNNFNKENEEIDTRSSYIPWIGGSENPIVGQEFEYKLWGYPTSYSNSWNAPLNSVVIAKSHNIIKLKFTREGEGQLTATVIDGSTNIALPTARLDIYAQPSKDKPNPGNPENPKAEVEITGPSFIGSHQNSVTYEVINLPANSCEYHWYVVRGNSFDIPPLEGNGKIVTIKRKDYTYGELRLEFMYSLDCDKGNSPVKFVYKNVTVQKPKTGTGVHEREVSVESRYDPTLKFLATITIKSGSEADIDIKLLNPEDIEDYYFLRKPNVDWIQYDDNKLEFEISAYTKPREGNRRISARDTHRKRFEFIIPPFQ